MHARDQASGPPKGGILLEISVSITFSGEGTMLEN
jgi:hypothetical protein